MRYGIDYCRVTRLKCKWASCVCVFFLIFYFSHFLVCVLRVLFSDEVYPIIEKVWKHALVARRYTFQFILYFLKMFRHVQNTQTQGAYVWINYKDKYVFKRKTNTVRLDLITIDFTVTTKIKRSHGKWPERFNYLLLVIEMLSISIKMFLLFYSREKFNDRKLKSLKITIQMHLCLSISEVNSTFILVLEIFKTANNNQIKCLQIKKKCIIKHSFTWFMNNMIFLQSEIIRKFNNIK